MADPMTEDDEGSDSNSWFDQFFSLSPINIEDIDILGFVSDGGEAYFKKAVELEHALNDKPRDIHKALKYYLKAEEDGHPTAENARLRLESRLPYYKERAIAAANVRDQLALHRQEVAAAERQKELEQTPKWLEKRRAIEKREEITPSVL